jgi:hypothetical protein
MVRVVSFPAVTVVGEGVTVRDGQANAGRAVRAMAATTAAAVPPAMRSRRRTGPGGRGEIRGTGFSLDGGCARQSGTSAARSGPSVYRRSEQAGPGPQGPGPRVTAARREGPRRQREQPSSLQ